MLFTSTNSSFFISPSRFYPLLANVLQWSKQSCIFTSSRLSEMSLETFNFSYIIYLYKFTFLFPPSPFTFLCYQGFISQCPVVEEVTLCIFMSARLSEVSLETLKCQAYYLPLQIYIFISPSSYILLNYQRIFSQCPILAKVVLYVLY